MFDILKEIGGKNQLVVDFCCSVFHFKLSTTVHYKALHMPDGKCAECVQFA